MQNVYGAIDSETRCRHYNVEQDRVAIKFYCCEAYYACYKCHQEEGCGHAKVWPRKLFNQPAVLCGACGIELTITDYVNGGAFCPACKASFNPGCSLHHHLYFSV